MAKVIIVYGRCEGKSIANLIGHDSCQVIEKIDNEKMSIHVAEGLSDSLIRLGNSVNKLSISFDELNETQKAFKENEQLPEPKSKYINKPRHNFKRR